MIRPLVTALAFCLAVCSGSSSASDAAPSVTGLTADSNASVSAKMYPIQLAWTEPKKDIKGQSISLLEYRVSWGPQSKPGTFNNIFRVGTNSATFNVTAGTYVFVVYARTPKAESAASNRVLKKVP